MTSAVLPSLVRGFFISTKKEVMWSWVLTFVRCSIQTCATGACEVNGGSTTTLGCEGLTPRAPHSGARSTSSASSPSVCRLGAPWQGMRCACGFGVWGRPQTKPSPTLFALGAREGRVGVEYFHHNIQIERSTCARPFHRQLGSCNRQPSFRDPQKLAPK